jgi:hypothetical protein
MIVVFASRFILIFLHSTSLVKFLLSLNAIRSTLDVRAGLCSRVVLSKPFHLHQGAKLEDRSLLFLDAQPKSLDAQDMSVKEEFLVKEFLVKVVFQQDVLKQLSLGVSRILPCQDAPTSLHNAFSR